MPRPMHGKPEKPKDFKQSIIRYFKSEPSNY